ncbi:uncharacterized protein LOC123526583 isoform X3 [Mercenaria mercenaria]|uniref:uncharacterized protein LOC123526583 isoform X3 n=1 Tax=Mercenaria mercenaria TaxID=6596 RepID=UPI00234F7743|nr:uncharacterized protein LOC123526583 isoform X3 [Mercenaria mercenaria]
MLCCASERSTFVFPLCGNKKSTQVVPTDAPPMTPVPEPMVPEVMSAQPNPVLHNPATVPTRPGQVLHNSTTVPSRPGSLAQNEVHAKSEPVPTKPRTMSVPGRLLATYPLLPSFKFSDTLDCYVDDIDSLDPDIPGPHPPPTKKVDIFSPADYTDVDARAVNTPTKFLKQSLKDLVDYLTAGYDDDLSKIRVIYRWITCQPIDLLPMKKTPSQGHAVFQLWRIKNKKGNYAQLVSLLCRYAKIPCVIIHGTLKGSTYEVGDPIDEDKHYGEWNAVLVDEHWRFINAYWGTCAEGASEDVSIPNGDDVIENGESASKLHYFCDENYFLTDPDQVVATHLPTLPKWQLKKDPLTPEEFEKMTFVKDRYFNLKLRTLTHPECIVRSNTGQVEIKFTIPRQTSLNIDFQYLLFRLNDGTEKRMDRYVFMHRTNNNENLTVKIRSPKEDVFRFELVGKDTTVTDENYDYDWIAIYKIIFTEGLKECQPFPPSPAVGWGPGRVAVETGLVPLSHFTGEVEMDDYGKAEIKFGTADKMKIGDMYYTAKVYTGGDTMEELPDYVVHRVENGDVIFNVMTPEKGEFVLRLFVKDGIDGKTREFCDYLLISRQIEENGRFPKGFQTRLGPKNPAFATSGLSPTKSSGFIRTEFDEVHIGFSRDEDIELSVNFSGENVKPAEAPLLLSQKEAGAVVTYTVRLPGTGQYGVKVRGTREDGTVHVPLYDYVIDYRKPKKRERKDLTIKQEAESFSTSDENEESSGEHMEKSEENLTDVLRRRLRLAIEENNPDELTAVIKEMKKLKLPSIQPDIKYAEEQLQILKIKKELLIAIRDKDAKKLKAALKKVKAADIGDKMEKEVSIAKNLVERLKKLQRLLHAVLDLDQSTIAEIRGYSNPPPIVHTVMMSTLLLLGHWEDETKVWKNVQCVLGKTGKESLKRLILEFKIEKCPLEVAMGAKDYLRDYSINQVRLVSAGCATFFVWVKGVVEELEKRAGEEINNIRPLTSRKRKKREMTFLGDLDQNSAR